jgi:ankyrin repeat protein
VTMSHPRITPSESLGEVAELSDFTSELLETLKGEFKNSLKRSSTQPAKENRLSLSLLADDIHSVRSDHMSGSGNGAREGDTETDLISDEMFIFNHIINCTKSLIEVTNAKNRRNGCKDIKKGSVLYSGLLDHIANMVKVTMVFPPSIDKETSGHSAGEMKPPSDGTESYNVFQSDIDRLYLTSHSLMTFPRLASDQTLYSSKNVPLLHYTVFNSCNISLTKAAYFSNPGAIKTPDKDGALPLHWAALGSDTNVVNFLLQKYPAAAGIADKAGYLPLHWAVNQDQPCENIYKLLINAYPQGVSVASPKNGTLPLHWCVNRPQPDIKLVKELIMAHSAGLRAPCQDGWLPLHYCVNHSKISLEVLALLLNRYPNATMYKNEEGQLPIHRLLDRERCSIKALKMILDVSPECLMVSDVEGYLPLHVALDGSIPPSWRLVKLLLQRGPNAIQKRTVYNFLPLHIAMKMNDSLGGEASTVDEELLSDDEFNQDTVRKLNTNRYLSIIQELTAEYPAAVHDVAVDVVPMEKNVTDLPSYTGEWKKTRWTPMSRAISKGKNSPIALLLRPFQKQKKTEMKSAANTVVATNRMGGPLVTPVGQGSKKLGPIMVRSSSRASESGGGEKDRDLKAPRRPPPRTKKDSKSQPADDGAKIEAENQAKIESEQKLALEAQAMAIENKEVPRIYTADMKEAGFYDDNDVSVIDDDEGGLKFNKGRSMDQFSERLKNPSSDSLRVVE